MKDADLVRFVSMGGAMGAMAGVLLGDGAMSVAWGFVIGVLSVFAWAWNHRFEDEPVPVAVAGEGAPAGTPD